jgi:hypothetical protein
MLVLIILGLLATSMQNQGQISLDLDTVYAEELGDQLEIDSPLGMDLTDMVEEPEFSVSDLIEVEDPLAAPDAMEPYLDGFLSTSDLSPPNIGLALTGRQEGAKDYLLGRFGGDGTTEAAVRRGLAWLARNQSDDGSWSLAGSYRDGVRGDFENRAAATAMALLAFQGDGNTHRRGKYRQNVIDGWQWLLRQQDTDGCFFREGGFNHRFYTQGLCTIALCELYGMTKDSAYGEPANRAVQYCLDSQSPQGGWRYSARNDSDVSVTGWIVMALQSARMAGLEVPDENLYHVGQFLDTACRENGSRYSYLPGQMPSLPMTAEALLCRQYLGWEHDDPRLIAGVEWITAKENLIDFASDRNAYSWYYATQVAHHMGGEYWRRWNKVMRQALPEQQVHSGPETGSWDPTSPTEDEYADEGGRLFVTCLSIYMLEVYYRHLPLYTNVYTDLLRSGRTDRR